MQIGAARGSLPRAVLLSIGSRMENLVQVAHLSLRKAGDVPPLKLGK